MRSSKSVALFVVSVCVSLARRSPGSPTSQPPNRGTPLAGPPGRRRCLRHLLVGDPHACTLLVGGLAWVRAFRLLARSILILLLLCLLRVSGKYACVCVGWRLRTGRDAGVADDDGNADLEGGDGPLGCALRMVACTAIARLQLAWLRFGRSSQKMWATSSNTLVTSFGWRTTAGAISSFVVGEAWSRSVGACGSAWRPRARTSQATR